MPAPHEREHPFNNHLLSMLPAEAYRQLHPQLEVVRTDFRQILFERHKPAEHVYFPCTSVFSVLAFLENGAAVEVGMIGNEGLSPIDAIMGSRMVTNSVHCQVAGESVRIRIADFEQAIAEDTPLRRIVQRFLLAYHSQVSQSVACNRMHTIEERFARWILMTRERVKENHFHLTQEFLADMLGVQRPSVSIVARTFQQAGLIRYTRGNLSILDRSGLESASCECYGIVRQQMERLLGTPSE